MSDRRQAHCSTVRLGLEGKLELPVAVVDTVPLSLRVQVCEPADTVRLQVFTVRIQHVEVGLAVVVRQRKFLQGRTRTCSL